MLKPMSTTALIFEDLSLGISFIRVPGSRTWHVKPHVNNSSQLHMPSSCGAMAPTHMVHGIVQRQIQVHRADF